MGMVGRARLPARHGDEGGDGLGANPGCALCAGVRGGFVARGLDAAPGPAAQARGHLVVAGVVRGAGGRSAGCVFRNPAPEHAGHLIERAGQKGLQRGDVRISPKHANFFLNIGRGSSGDFLALAEGVREAVLLSSGHRLDLEVKVWR